MISVNNLTVAFGGRVLFDEISFLVTRKDRIGLVGKNGAGKSTLLKTIAGLQSSNGGEIAMPNNFKIGYLPQELKVTDGKTVMEEASSAFGEVLTVEKKLEEVNQEIAERTDYESDSYMKLINKLNDLTHQFTMLDGHAIHEKSEKILMGLGFERSDLDRPTSEFSGGWRMRIELAKILLQAPDGLLLDEPTNHLDIESIQWFEQFLINYDGAIILISHDRAFLDNITNRTIEISLGRIFDFKANYSKYLVLREEQREQQTNAFKNQQKHIEQTEKLINKFRAKASKATMAQSLIKKLDRLDRIEIDEEDTSTMRIRFPEPPRSGKTVIELKHVSKSYGDNHVLNDLNFLIARGEKVAFVGKNGMGKTTLAKVIVKEIKHEGEVVLGHNVSIGYFAQNQTEKLNPNHTVFETINSVAEGEVRKKVRALLGAFMFSGEDVDKKVKVLSGGEKMRLAMCQLLLHEHNVLILDEPTHHLDIRSKDVLKDALANFEGTIILVSHDRDFLDGLADKVYEFRKGEVKEHLGGIYEFLQKRKLTNLTELNTNATEAPKKADIKPSENKENYQRKKEVEKEYRSLKKDVEKAERRIEKLETELAAYDEKLQDPEQYKKVFSDSEVFEKYNTLKKDLEKEMARWEKAAADLEKVEQEKESLQA